MIPAGFAYSRPASLDEAMALLAQSGGGAKVIAGGMSLLPLLKLRLAQRGSAGRHRAAARSCKASAGWPTGAWRSGP